MREVAAGEIDWKAPVARYAHTDFVVLDEELSVEEAVARVRGLVDDSRIVYFYTVDAGGRLKGVLQVRSLITRLPGTRLSEIHKTDLVMVRADESLAEVAKRFASYKYLSIPVVDAEGRIKGVIDLRVFAKGDFDLSARSAVEEVFSTIGVRVSGYGRISPLAAFGRRFPWLGSTIASGFACAIIAGAFQAGLGKSLILTFFLTLVLALGESACIQSMSLALQQVPPGPVRARRFLRLFAKEAAVGLLLGGASGAIVTLLSWAIGGNPAAAALIGGAICGSMTCASLFGFLVPVLLHNLRLDPKIASGPIALSLADICTTALYLGGAAALL